MRAEALELQHLGEVRLHFSDLLEELNEWKYEAVREILRV
jgi:hypothetical protein